MDGSKDKSDIENLIAIVGIGSREDLIAHAARYYPEARVSAKLILAAEQLILDANRDTDADATPRYLDRSGRGEPGE